MPFNPVAEARKSTKFLLREHAFIWNKNSFSARYFNEF